MRHLVRRLTTEFCFCLMLWLAGCRSSQTAEQASWPEVNLTAQDRILILAPHPDDEVLGCAGIIQHAVAKGIPLRVVVFTYGDSNQWSFMVYRKRPVLGAGAAQRMGLLRHDETLAADKVLGLSPEQLTFLGYPDFGTLHIWYSHWGDRPPFKGLLTRATAVPYDSAFRPGAPYKGEEILRDLTSVFREFGPTKIFVSHPADHNADHCALYLFTQVALWNIESEMKPQVYPYLVHAKRWPQPRGLHATLSLEPPSALMHQVQWQQGTLSPEEIDRKRAAVETYRTQYSYSANYLLSFVRPNELFGDFPVITLHPGIPNGSLTPGSSPNVDEIPEELSEAERAAFVGLEWRFVRLEDGHLALSFAFSRPLAETVEASIFFFGYRSDRPFAEMPKLRLAVGAIRQDAFDQDRKLPAGLIRVSRESRQITAQVSLEALGNPQRVLLSARTYVGEVPLDWAAWRTVELRTNQ